MGEAETRYEGWGTGRLPNTGAIDPEQARTAREGRAFATAGRLRGATESAMTGVICLALVRARKAAARQTATRKDKAEVKDLERKLEEL